MHRRSIWIAGLVLAAAAVPAHATTKGLSQIVTPDLQGAGTLSVSAQWQARQIGNPYQLQLEAGLTDWLEAAYFQGLSPGDESFGALARLVQHEPWLLTAGFVNWSAHGGGAQPLVEGGYYLEHHKVMAGVVDADHRGQAIAGWAYDFNPTWRAQIDWQGGHAGWWTVGYTQNVTPRFQYNPAVYVSNSDSSRIVGYVVGTYTFTLWRR